MKEALKALGEEEDEEPEEVKAAPAKRDEIKTRDDTEMKQPS